LILLDEELFYSSYLLIIVFIARQHGRATVSMHGPTGSCGKRIRRGITITRGDFEVFDRRSTPSIQGWGCGPQKLKILPKFHNINASERRIPQTIFTKFSSFVDSSIDSHLLKMGNEHELSNSVIFMTLSDVNSFHQW